MDSKTADGLVHVIQLEGAKSLPGWANYKVRTLKRLEDTNDKEVEQGTETQLLVPQYKGRKDIKPYCYDFEKPVHLK